MLNSKLLLNTRSFLIALTLFLILTTPLAYSHSDGGILVKDAWVRESPPVSPVLAGYMVIENHTGETQELLSVTSPAFQKIEIHKTVYKDGMASMEGQNKLPIAAENKVVLKPGGTHLMLINPSKPLKAGDSVVFEFKFANGSKYVITAPVKKGGAMAHEQQMHHEHQHMQ